MPDNLRSFINFYYISFENLKTNVLTHSKIKPNKYPKTNNYKKTIETLTEKKKEVLEPIMNDLEVQKENEIIEVQTPIIEQSPIIEYKPNYFLSLLAKLP